jgi:hypothetical protein
MPRSIIGLFGQRHMDIGEAVEKAPRRIKKARNLVASKTQTIPSPDRAVLFGTLLAAIGDRDEANEAWQDWGWESEPGIGFLETEEVQS